MALESYKWELLYQWANMYSLFLDIAKFPSLVLYYLHVQWHCRRMVVFFQSHHRECYLLDLCQSHGRRSLVGCSPWGLGESDTTEQLPFHFSLSCIGEGNGNPLQCSCLENPRDGGARWAAVYGVTQSRTWLKRLSSSSSRPTRNEYNKVNVFPKISSTKMQIFYCCTLSAKCWVLF